MRPRTAVPALLAVVAVAAMPSAAAAHPVHNRGLTIAVTPNDITAGESVLIYGKLLGPDVSDQTVTLYHRVNPHIGYSVVSRTTTNSLGVYEFPRADGIVDSNREWFVRGPGTSHSRTVHERVSAEVSIASSVSTTDTKTPVTFTGSVSPLHIGQEILIQVPATYNNGWRTVATGRIGAQGAFSVARRFRTPGIKTVRALLKSDGRNIASPSDSLTVAVQQAQIPGFSISSSQPIISEGGSMTISGVLDQSGTNVVESGATVTLLENVHGTPGTPATPVATMVTGTNGSYAFANLVPTTNSSYRVVQEKTPTTSFRSTASLFQGVADVVNLTATPATADIGQAVTFSGSASPAVAGQDIYLQRQAPNGAWYDVGEHVIGADGSYTFYRVFGNAGTHLFRTRIYGDGQNVGGASAPEAITVAGTVAPTSSLPPATS